MQCLSYLKYRFIWQHISESWQTTTFLMLLFSSRVQDDPSLSFQDLSSWYSKTEQTKQTAAFQFSLDFLAAAHLRSARLAQSYCTYATAVRGLFLQQWNSWIGVKTSAWIMSRPWRKLMVLILRYLTSDNISMSDSTFITEIQSYGAALSSH